MARTCARLKEEFEKVPQRIRQPHKVANISFAGKRAVELPTSPEGRIRLYEELVGRAKSCELTPRCRPKVSVIMVKVHDSLNREVMVNIAYLQLYSDRMRALRECIEVMFPSTTDVYKRMDLDGCGTLSFKELETVFRRLHIPWQQITGLTRSELLQILGSGRIDILQFLGKPGLTVRPHWSSLSLRNQWEDYYKKVYDLNLDSTACCPPLWSNIGPLEEAIRLRPSTISGPLAREDSDYLQTKVVRIEKFLADFAENKRELMKLKMELSGVTESEERLAEIKRRRDEEEREKDRIKKAAGMALVTTDGNNKISLFGKKGQSSVFNEPSRDDMLNAFSGLVDEKDLARRKLYTEVGLSLLVGDRIHAAMRKYTNQDNIYQNDFELIMKDLRKILTARTGIAKIVAEWVSVSQGRDSLSIKEFLTFCARPETGFINA